MAICCDHLRLIIFGAGAILMFLLRWPLAHQFGNPSLADVALPMALVAFFMVVTAPMEIQLTSEGKVRDAAVAIFASELVRVGASVVPLAMGYGLTGLIWANVFHGAVRAIACVWLLWARGGPAWRAPVFREQLAYSLPFGAAILLLIPQQQFHQYAVGAMVTPTEFAVYMVGCFQVPIIGLLYSPISDVLQVRLAAPGGRDHAVSLFHEANLRLAAVFFPLCLGLLAAGGLFIPALFTHRYDDSVPIFRWALLGIPFAALPLDGMLRALGQTKYIFRNSAAKLGVTVPAVLFGMKVGGMTGAIAAYGFSEILLRIAMVARVRRELEVSWTKLLPWAHLSRLAVAAAVACAPVVLISLLPRAHEKPFPWLMASGALYAFTYAVVLVVGGGSGTPAMRLKRALLGNADDAVPVAQPAAQVQSSAA